MTTDLFYKLTFSSVKVVYVLFRVVANVIFPPGSCGHPLGDGGQYLFGSRPHLSPLALQPRKQKDNIEVREKYNIKKVEHDRLPTCIPRPTTHNTRFFPRTYRISKTYVAFSQLCHQNTAEQGNNVMYINGYGYLQFMQVNIANEARRQILKL